MPSMITSRSVETLLHAHKDCDTLTPSGAGIDLLGVLRDMLKISITEAGLYDHDYLEAQGITKLIDIVINDTRELTIDEMNTLINNLGSRLFLSFCERQLDYDNAKAWDIGVSHALEVRGKLDKLLSITDILTDSMAEPEDG